MKLKSLYLFHTDLKKRCPCFKNYWKQSLPRNDDGRTPATLPYHIKVVSHLWYDLPTLLLTLRFCQISWRNWLPQQGHLVKTLLPSPSFEHLTRNQLQQFHTNKHNGGVALFCHEKSYSTQLQLHVYEGTVGLALRDPTPFTASIILDIPRGPAPTTLPKDPLLTNLICISDTPRI